MLNKLLESKINKICLHTGKDKAELINELLEKGLHCYNTEMSGGFTMAIPSPTHYHINKAELREFLSLLISTHKNNKSGYRVPLLSLVHFIDQRVFLDNELDKQNYENYFLSVQCETSQSDK